MHRLMIVEDDLVIASELRRHLEKWGYEAICAEDLHDVAAEFDRLAPDLVLMDISLPFFNGYHWCGEIRKRSSAPILFLSSASDNMNILMALSMGGDDFISKPFDLDVLTAKIQATLRRVYDFSEPARVLSHRGASLSLSDASLTCPEGRAELTRNEFKILQLLLERKGQVVSREAIMECLWATDSFIDDNTLTVNVARLRKKLEALGLCGFIATRKGMGYIVE